MKTGFIGAGKVGFSLGKMFAESGLPLTGYYSRQREAAQEAAAGAVVSSIPFYKIMGIGCGILFLVLGNIMPKTKPNPIMGVRLPWLEDHPEAWRKSQRAGGIAFAAAGALCLVLSLFLQGAALFWVIMICALGAAVVSCIVSLRFSRAQ